MEEELFYARADFWIPLIAFLRKKGFSHSDIMDLSLFELCVWVDQLIPKDPFDPEEI